MSEQEPSQVPPQETPAAGAPPPPAEQAWTPSGPSGPRASFGRRLVAFLIDYFILIVIYFIVYAITDQTVSTLVSIVVGLAYFAYLEGGPRGQTLGKMVMDIRVIDFNTGGAIGYGRGALRYVGRILSQLVCFLGYFWMLWDKEKQTWHDKIATTVVVPVANYPLP